MRQDFAHPSPTLTVLGKLKRRARERYHALIGAHSRQSLGTSHFWWQRFTMELVQKWFVIK